MVHLKRPVLQIGSTPSFLGYLFNCMYLHFEIHVTVCTDIKNKQYRHNFFLLHTPKYWSVHYKICKRQLRFKSCITKSLKCPDDGRYRYTMYHPLLCFTIIDTCFIQRYSVERWQCPDLTTWVNHILHKCRVQFSSCVDCISHWYPWQVLIKPTVLYL